MSEPENSAPGLPDMIPIFPLAGVLLLPRGRLPLNIFEPRYLAMTTDALGGGRLIGMIQPSDPGAGGLNPPVYPTGCAGRIASFSETNDGRYLITLAGVSRFRIREELPLLRGYRRVVPEWGEFADDLDPVDVSGLDRERLIDALKGYFAQQQLNADWEAMRAAPAEELVTSLAMMCPFDPGEKQALLQAASFAERARMLTEIVEMAALSPSQQPGSGARH